MGKWEKSTIGCINRYKGKSINPLKTSDVTYELYSVPSWDDNYPEIIKGSEIGSTKQVAEKGDVLLCKINPRINRVWVVEQYTEYPIIASSEWIIVRNKDIDSRYLSKYFQSSVFREMMVSEQSGIGGSLTRAQPKRVNDYPVPLPPLPVQRQIAVVLDRASALIEKRKTQIGKLDLLVKSQFIEMFGNPVTNPKGWEVQKLKNITTSIQSGNTPKGGKQVYVDSGIMFFRSQNVWKNRIELADIAYIDEKTHRKMSQTRLKHKDILITKTGRFNTENSSLGRASLFWGEDDSANINGHVYLVRLKESIVHEFILYILITDEYRDYIRKVCVGGIDKRQINKEHLEEFPIIMPPTKLQHQFADFFLRVEEQKSMLQQSCAKLELTYESLMQKCFRGDLF